MRLAFSAVLLLIFGACGHVVPDTLTSDGRPFDFKQKHDCADPDADPVKVEVRYLGSGGVWIAWRGEAILIGPSFSNPSLWRAAVWRAGYNDEWINDALEPIERRHVPLKAILAGHSHYDHIFDLPRIASRKGMQDAQIHVNASGMKMLHAEPQLLGRAHELRENALIPISDGIHVRAVRSSHAPQICAWRIGLCMYAGGSVREEWQTPWTQHRLWSFRGGDTFAFVIELRDNGVSRYRIYYNDSAADAPERPLVDRPVDLAVLCMAQWTRARDYPRGLLAALEPDHVVVSHWDDFFGRRKVGSRFVPTLSNGSAERFLRVVEEKVKGNGAPSNEVCGARAKSKKWTMPAVGAAMQFLPRE